MDQFATQWNGGRAGAHLMHPHRGLISEGEVIGAMTRVTCFRYDEHRVDPAEKMFS